VLLRDLGGAALYPVDSADWSGSCLEENGTDSRAPQLLHILYNAFTSLARKSRGILLDTLQEDIRTSSLHTVSGLHKHALSLSTVAFWGTPSELPDLSQCLASNRNEYQKH
jgi:hypothetical protein